MAYTNSINYWYRLASAIRMSADLAKLINKNYQKFTSQYEVDDYIRSLRRELVTLKLQNDFLLKEESYIPIKVERNYPFKNEELLVKDIEEPNRDFIAITITFDQKKFPQLIITPLHQQIKYIEKVISTIIYEQHITAVYGSFERQKNGYIHAHLIAPYYGDHNNLEKQLSTYFTNRTGEQQHAVLIKPVTDLNKWLIYINKKEDFKEFIEYNLKIKSLNDI